MWDRGVRWRRRPGGRRVLRVCAGLLLWVWLPALGAGADPRTLAVSERLLEDLKAEDVAGEVIARLEGSTGRRFSGEEAFSEFLDTSLGAETAETKLGRGRTLRDMLIAFADTRIDEELADDAPIPDPMSYAIGERELAGLLASGEYRYVGNLKCRVCHREFFLGRKRDAHVGALRLSVPKRYAGERRCVVCHTTGHGLPGGYVDAESSKKVRGVTCEGCHGPGSKHCDMRSEGGLLVGNGQGDRMKRLCDACHGGRWKRSFESAEVAYEDYRQAEAHAQKLAGR